MYILSSSCNDDDDSPYCKGMELSEINPSINKLSLIFPEIFKSTSVLIVKF